MYCQHLSFTLTYYVQKQRRMQTSKYNIEKSLPLATALITTISASGPADAPKLPRPTLPQTLTSLFTLITQAEDIQAPIPRLLDEYQSGGDSPSP